MALRAADARDQALVSARFRLKEPNGDAKKDEKRTMIRRNVPKEDTN